MSNNFLPDFIEEYIFKDNEAPDIIILTEFAQKQVKNVKEFKESLKKKSYSIFVTDNGGNRNNILIAVKNNYEADTNCNEPEFNLDNALII